MTRSSIANKIVRPTIWASLCLVVIFQMVCLRCEASGDTIDNRVTWDAERNNAFWKLIKGEEKDPNWIDPSEKTVNWSGGSCGCVLDDLSGVVYGFYPFWMAGDKQLVDFSVLTRIGYCAATLNDEGTIEKERHWVKNKAKFIKEAHKYRTKMDLVIYIDTNNQWQKWRQGDKKEEVIKHFVDSLNEKKMGDGVTLYFDGNVSDDASGEFSYFIKALRGQLREKLNKAGRDYHLNIMLSMDQIGKGLYKYSNLAALTPDVEAVDPKYEGKNFVDLFLVFLKDPNTHNKDPNTHNKDPNTHNIEELKKELRKQVEDTPEIHGIQRRNLLRKIVPVIRVGGDHYKDNKEQFHDDIIYFEDNFGGVGLCPLPMSTDNGSEDEGKITVKDVNTALTKLYRKEGAKPVSSIFKFVCPNRWMFRIIWDIFSAIFLVSIVLYFTICEWRALFMKYYLYFILGVVLPWFLLSLFLLYYDPYWKKIAEGNTPLIIIVLGIISYALWQYFKKKGEAELP